MFFPIGDTNLIKGTKPFFSYALIAVNVIIFVMQFLMPAEMEQSFVNTYGCVPAKILHGENMYTLFTNMFLHGSWAHLLGNMVFLWIFADNIEATVGYLRFLLFYFVGGIAASLTHVFFNIGSLSPSIGASGAIAACLGAYLIMFPTSKVKVFVLFIFSSINVPAILFLGIWIAQQFMNGLGTLSNTASTSNVAYWAHIGGFIYGIVCGFLFKNKAVEIQKKQ